MSTPATLRIDQIQKTDNALRQVDVESEQFQEILDSVKELGVLNPISVRPTADPELYELVDGRHRLTAATEAGHESINVNILDAMSDYELQRAQLVANSARIETRPAEYANQIKRMLAANPDVTVHDIAKEIFRTAQWVTKIMRLTKLPEPVQAKVDEGAITLQNAVALSDLPDEEIPEWIDRAIEMAGEEFVPEVAARAREIKEEKRTGKKAAPETFSPKAKARKGALLIEEHANGGPSVTALCGNQDEINGALKALAWVVQMDDETVAEAEAVWNAKKQARAEADERRKREKLEKAQAKNAAQAEELQAQLAEIADQ